MSAVPDGQERIKGFLCCCGRGRQGLTPEARFSSQEGIMTIRHEDALLIETLLVYRVDYNSLGTEHF